MEMKWNQAYGWSTIWCNQNSEFIFDVPQFQSAIYLFDDYTFNFVRDKVLFC